MDLGHGFIPRIDRRNYKAVERCLAQGGEGLFHEGLELPWAVLEGPWALSSGASTLELCRDRRVAFMVDTQAWRYHDPRTFVPGKFMDTPNAPAAPLVGCSPACLRYFVEADLAAQASLGATAYLLPGIVPSSRGDDVRERTLALLDAAYPSVLADPRPCVAFLGAHASSMEVAHQLVEDLPLWITGVYLQLTPVNPLTDSASKIIDCLVLMRHLVQRGFIVIGGRLAGLGVLARALGVHGTDAGLGEGESFAYNSKVRNSEPRADDAPKPRPLGGRTYVPQLGRSVSSKEWARLMQVPALRGLLMCRLPCCAFGQGVEATPTRGREHSLHTRIAELKGSSGSGSRAEIGRAIQVLEQRQSTARTVTDSLAAAGHDPLSTGFIDNHLAVARFFQDAISDAA